MFVQAGAIVYVCLIVFHFRSSMSLMSLLGQHLPRRRQTAVQTRQPHAYRRMLHEHCPIRLDIRLLPIYQPEKGQEVELVD